MTTQLAETEFRARVREVGEEIASWSVERAGSRDSIRLLGAAGVLAARWDPPRDRYGVALVEELSVLGLTGTAVVVSLHTESFLGMLRQFGRPALADVVAGALAGTVVGCVAASEPGGGSDLASVETTAARTEAGWYISGEKKFVTMAAEADHAVVLCRFAESPGGQLGAFVIPRCGYEVRKTHDLHAGSPGTTSWITIDTTVSVDNLLGQAGLGLAVLNWGLTKERLAVAALVVGVCRLSLALATTHAKVRRQFGVPLFDHQAIRLRLADLAARLHTLMSDLHHLAGQPPDPRRIAGLKVTAARFGEQCVSECMHIFGGDGYTVDATPLGRLWRDIRLARIGGGTDELMWEIVASGLVPDHDSYRRHITGAGPGSNGAERAMKNTTTRKTENDD